MLPKQLFISNEQGAQLKDKFAELVGASAQLRMLVGYFYFSGMRMLYNSLQANPDIKLRVLVGMDAELAVGRVVETVRRAGHDPRSDDEIFADYLAELRRVLGSEAVDNEAFHTRVGFFIELLRSGRLGIRKTREANHGKMYLFTIKDGLPFKHSIITGSSNFTQPGLVGQGEINAWINDTGWDAADNYFEDWWDDAVELSAPEQIEKIAKVIERGSVAAQVTPYEAWLRILMEYVDSRKGELSAALYSETLKAAGMTEFSYQKDAVIQAEKILAENGGVIIADVVGLGKSVIGSLIGKLSRKRGFILAPPGLCGDKEAKSGWRMYRRLFRLDGWKVWSSGDLEGALAYLAGDPNFELVLIDEVHRFRNMGTADYDRILRICNGRQVVALTATPFNNRPNDILALLHLFSPLKGSSLVAGGDLETAFTNFNLRFKAIEKARKLLDDGEATETERLDALADAGIDRLAAAELDRAGRLARLTTQMETLGRKMRGIMANVTIRRNRLDLREDPDYREEVKGVVTPEPPLPQYYGLSDEQDAFYDKVIHDWFGEHGAFKGPFYRPQRYLCANGDAGCVASIAGNGDGGEVSQENLYKFMRRLLVRRFESSFGAFRKSVENQLAFLTRMKGFVEKSGVFIYASGVGKEIEALMAETDADAFEAALAELVARKEAEAKLKAREVRTTYTLDDANFDTDRFFADIESDIALFTQVLGAFTASGIGGEDPKAQSLIETCKKIVAGAHEEIAKEKTKRKVVVFTEFKDTLDHLAREFEQSGVRTLVAYSVSEAVLENFDAGYGARKQKDAYDVLLTTDKLSEGLNLNRAGAVVNYDIPWNPTRVIQRVGRINRIGRQVFDKLYILNFFPTRKGEDIARTRQVAEMKILAIHAALGEDAQFLSEDAQPTASELFEKLGQFRGDDEGEVSFYTRAKRELAKARTEHPETVEKVAALPGFIKTALPGNGTDVYFFERQGQMFRARKWDGAQVVEVELPDAVEAVKREFGTPAGRLPEGFWDKGQRPGIYSMLKNYTVASEANAADTKSHKVKALAALDGYLRAANGDAGCVASIAGTDAGAVPWHAAFARALMRDISECGSLGISEYKLRQIWVRAKQGTGMLVDYIDRLWREGGGVDDYLAARKTTTAPRAVIVTVANG